MPIWKQVLLLFVIPIVYLPIAVSGPGDVVGNGGGISEQNLIYSWLRLPLLPEASLNHSSCTLDREERGWIRLATEELRRYPDPARLRFIEGTRFPEKFRTTPEGALDVTSSEEGAGGKIWVNTELLHNPETGNPFGLAQSAATLFRELLIHQKVVEPFANRTRALHAKLRACLSPLLQSALQTFHPIRDLSLLSFSGVWTDAKQVWVLGDGEHLYEVGLPQTPAACESSTVERARLTRVRWTPELDKTLEHGVALQALASIEILCRPNGYEKRMEGKLKLYLPFEFRSGSFEDLVRGKSAELRARPEHFRLQYFDLRETP